MRSYELRGKQEASKDRQTNYIKVYAVVFEEDYFLLKWAVGEELRGVRDNKAPCHNGKLKFVCGAVSLSVTITVDCELAGIGSYNAKRRLTVADEKQTASCTQGKESDNMASFGIGNIRTLSQSDSCL